MLADFTKQLQTILEKAATPKVMDSPDPRHMLIATGNTTTTFPIKRPRASVFLDLASFIDAVEANTAAGEAEIYHTADMVCCVMNKDDRWDTLLLKLETTQHWQTLLALTTAAAFSQKQAVRLLRHDLAAAGCEAMLAALRRIDFTRRADGTRTIEHGRESLGKSVENAIQNADQIPADFRAWTAVYSTPGCAWPVEIPLTVDLDAEAERIIVAVLPDAMAKALDDTQDRLHHALQDALPEYDVYHGTP